MAKGIVYLVTSHGEDGRGKERIEFASVNEAERDTWHNNHKNKNWNGIADRIVDIEIEKTEALIQLNALDKLLLGINVPSQDHIPSDITGKQILFLVTSIGTRGKENIYFASLNEQMRDGWHNADKFKTHRDKTDRIINVDAEKTKAMKQLNALQKFALGLEQPACIKKK